MIRRWVEARRKERREIRIRLRRSELQRFKEIAEEMRPYSINMETGERIKLPLPGRWRLRLR